MSGGIGATRKFSLLLSIVVLLVVLATLTPASAAPARIVAGPRNLFYTNVVVVQKGQTATFINLDLAPHNVWSARAPAGSLFKSADVTFLKQTPVTGVKNLPRGTYKFLCTIHQGMTGTLRVV